jgi:MoaA/NifB/PqqE/SkfB family radical SAM enzyme
MYFDIDDEFLEHFRNLKQVFLYVTNECNLRCIHCLYKPNLIFHLKEKEIPLDVALALLSDFKELGASKLSITGGEPTLYGIAEGNKPLLKLISEAKRLGYEYIRIGTNGTFDSSLLLKKEFKELNEITFSLEGFNPQMNDQFRGEGTFSKCVANIKKAVELGYTVDITCCLHKDLLKRDKNGILLLDYMIHFAESLGVSRINFHDLFKFGVPMDAWTGNFDPPIKDWVNIYEEMRRNIEKKMYKISVRLPQCVVSREEFEKNPEYYGYCPAKMGERVLVHPEGVIRICSNMIGSPYGVARFHSGKITWDRSSTNELRDHDLKNFTPCTNRSKGKNLGDLVPLCFSFKPEQDEMIWKEKLNWDQRKINIIDKS